MPYSAVNFAIFENTVKALSPLLKATSEGGTLASEVCFLLVCVLVCAEAMQQMLPNREAMPHYWPNGPLLLGHAKAPCSFGLTATSVYCKAMFCNPADPGHVTWRDTWRDMLQSMADATSGEVLFSWHITQCICGAHHGHSCLLAEDCWSSFSAQHMLCILHARHSRHFVTGLCVWFLNC
jgi:hypothetical protein